MLSYCKLERFIWIGSPIILFSLFYTSSDSFSSGTYPSFLFLTAFTTKHTTAVIQTDEIKTPTITAITITPVGAEMSSPSISLGTHASMRESYRLVDETAILFFVFI